MTEQKSKKVQGRILAKTPKAVRLQFKSGQEHWIAKSTINSECNLQSNTFQPFSIQSWVLEKNNILTEKKEVLDRILEKVKEYHEDNLIVIYGIGSYFDEKLPEGWIKNDIDFILVVKSIEHIPKGKWNRRFFPEEMEGFDVFTGYNTLEMYQDEEQFREFSGANYRWALMEIKDPANSVLLYGKDIRNKLPDFTTIPYDYDDILARGVYHLEKSLKETNQEKPDLTIERKEFSKGILKISFYLCIYFSDTFHNTSIVDIEKKINDIVQFISPLNEFETYFEEAKHFRMTGKFKTTFKPLREDFLLYLIGLLKNGVLHKKFTNPMIVTFFTNYFRGFVHLKKWFEAL